MTKKCPECGKKNSLSNKYCEKCGHKLKKEIKVKKNTTGEWIALFVLAVIFPLFYPILGSIAIVWSIIHLIQISHGTRDEKGKTLYILVIIIASLVSIISFVIWFVFSFVYVLSSLGSVR